MTTQTDPYYAFMSKTKAYSLSGKKAPQGFTLAPQNLFKLMLEAHMLLLKNSSVDRLEELKDRLGAITHAFALKLLIRLKQKNGFDMGLVKSFWPELGEIVLGEDFIRTSIPIIPASKHNPRTCLLYFTTKKDGTNATLYLSEGTGVDYHEGEPFVLGPKYTDLIKNITSIGVEDFLKSGAVPDGYRKMED